jgi:hypothetical protein
VLLVINAIDEISKTGKYDKYSIFYYIKYLKLNKDLIQLVEQRSLSSILSLYIQKALKSANIGYHRNKIKSFAFTIHLYFYFNFDSTIRVISLKVKFKQDKFDRLRQHYYRVNALHLFYTETSIVLNSYIRELIELEYLKIQQKNELTNLDLKKIKDLEEFIFLVIKMLLYYLWDFENINKLDNNFNFDSLHIDDTLTILSNHDYYDNDKVKTIIKFININKIHFFHIHRNKEFYEQFYLYANLLNIYYKIGMVDFENYNNIENYVEIFLYNLSVLKLYKQELPDNLIEQLILKRLNEYKKLFIEE